MHLSADLGGDHQRLPPVLLGGDPRTLLRRRGEESEPRHPVEDLLPEEVRKELKDEFLAGVGRRPPSVWLPGAAEPHLTRLEGEDEILEVALLFAGEEDAEFKGLVHVRAQQSRIAVLYDSGVERPGGGETVVLDPWEHGIISSGIL